VYDPTPTCKQETPRSEKFLLKKRIDIARDGCIPRKTWLLTRRTGLVIGSRIDSSSRLHHCLTDFAVHAPAFSCPSRNKNSQNKVLTLSAICCFLSPDYATDFGQLKLFFLAQHDFGRGVIQAVAG